MDVDVEVAMEVPGDVELVDLAADKTEGRLGGFLHDLAQLSGQGEAPLAVDLVGLEPQELAAELRPGHPGRYAHLVPLIEFGAPELGDSEERLQVLRRDLLGMLPAFLDDTLHDLAADRRDLPLQAPDAGLPRVAADELKKGLVRDFQVGLTQTVGVHLLGQEEALGDLELFVLRVAGKADDLHPVEQGPAGWGRACSP